MPKLENLLNFVSFTHKFNQVKRVIYATGEDRKENDSEHSYQLALVAWYLIDSRKLSLNIDRCIRYALAHDLVEVYAGDTYVYSNDQAHKDSKNEREHDALKRITAEFPEFSDLITWIIQYEAREDEESRFIYALDKLVAPMNVYLNEGKSWRENKVSFDMIVEGKTSKVAVSPEIKELWNEFVSLLTPKKEELFAPRVEQNI